MTSDERIVAALIECGSVGAAAEACGLSPRTVYNRMGERQFVQLYEAAKLDLVRQAVFSVGAKMSAAANTVAEIMADETVPPAVRLKAAGMILDSAQKFTERLSADEFAVRQKKGNELTAFLDNDF